MPCHFVYSHVLSQGVCEGLIPGPCHKQTNLLSTDQAAGWLNLTLVSEFQVPTSDHFRPFLAVKKVKELALRVVTKNALTHSIFDRI